MRTPFPALFLLLSAPALSTELTASQREQVDALVAGQIAEEKDQVHCEVGTLVDSIKTATDCQSAFELGRCAKEYRDAGRPPPAEINAEVVARTLAVLEGIPADKEGWSNRNHCASALLLLAAPEAVPAVIKVLAAKPPVPSWTSSAWEEIDELPDERFVPLIKKARLDRSGAASAIKMLGKLGTKGLPLLERYAKGKDEYLRREAMEAIANIDWPRAQVLLRKLPKNDWRLNEIRLEHESLARQEADGLCPQSTLVPEDAERVVYLVRLAVDSEADPTMKQKAVELVVSLGAAAVPELRKCLRSGAHRDMRGGIPEYYEAQDAAGMLQRIGEPAIGCLVQGLDDTRARQAVAEVLWKLTGQKLDWTYDAWSKWFREARKDKP